MTPSVPNYRVLLSGLVLSALFAAPLFGQAPKTAASAGVAQAPASPFSGEVVEERVAQVNDQIISLSDYERAEQQMEADAKQQGWSEQELAEQKHNLMRDLIDKELLLSKGKELGITGETELVKRLDDIRKQNHLDSMEDLEKAAQEQGVSYEDFKQKIRDEIIIQEVTRQEVARKIQLTKAEVDAYYRAHQAEFVQPESVHLDEILIPVASDDAAALEAAQAKAAEVEAKLKAGANFEDLAKQDSGGPTAATGGELGTYKRGQLAKPIEDATFALKAGQTTAPIRTKQGLLILKVTEHTGGNSQDFASIEPQVEEAAFMSRMQPELRQYLTTLRSQAYLDIRPGYEDSGKSTSTIKPIFAAYTPPGKKKEKAKVQRTRFRETGHSLKKASATQQASTSAPAAGAAKTAATAEGIPASSAAKPTQVAANNTVSTKRVKRQKVRYGQAPQGTLDNAPGNTATNVTDTSGADAKDAAQVASNSVSSNITGIGVAEAAPAAAEKKTRFSDRKGKKVKGPTQDQLENEAQGTATPEEVATQQTQAAPVGLEGDTSTKKKQPKVKNEQKTRYSDKSKEPTSAGSTNAGQAAAPDATSPDATRPANATAPASAPADTSTPQASPQSNPQ